MMTNVDEWIVYTFVENLWDSFQCYPLIHDERKKFQQRGNRLPHVHYMTRALVSLFHKDILLTIRNAIVAWPMAYLFYKTSSLVKHDDLWYFIEEFCTPHVTKVARVQALHFSKAMCSSFACAFFIEAVGSSHVSLVARAMAWYDSDFYEGNWLATRKPSGASDYKVCLWFLLRQLAHHTRAEWRERWLLNFT